VLLVLSVSQLPVIYVLSMCLKLIYSLLAVYPLLKRLLPALCFLYYVVRVALVLGCKLMPCHLRVIYAAYANA